MKSDIEIALESQKKDIREIARKININEEQLEMYGRYKAKINTDIQKGDGDLILVTSINPTRAGEGKSTVTVGLVDSMNELSKRTIGVMRQPSMGPVFGLKGGASGGGYSQVIPMEDINLHFTGDMHAITSANNLICACIDNHIHHSNDLKIDIDNIFFKRTVDMNDRSLREITIGQGKSINGVERNDGFTITAASEIMAVLCLSNDLKELKEKIGRIIIGKNRSGEIVTVKDLNIVGAVCLILKDALKPNLVQTIKNNPVLLHGGPFANIAHGCNSIIATKTALGLADYVVTEAGFGADLGSEKFINIKSRIGNLSPKAIVIVATVRALKMHGAVEYDLLEKENVEAVRNGLENLQRHIEIVSSYGVDFVVAINRFQSDTKDEIDAILKYAEENGYKACDIDVFTDNEQGAKQLANIVVDICSKENRDKPIFTYSETDNLLEKIRKVVSLYGASGFELGEEAKEDLKFIKDNKLDNLLICMAKTPSSFTDDPKIIGAPKDFTIKINRLRVANGAGFIICMIGNTMLMPGLPKVPQAEKMNILENGIIEGLN